MSSCDRIPPGRSPGPKLKSSAFIVGLFALLASAGCGGGSPGNGGGGPVAASVIGTIAVGTGPEGIDVDPTSNNVYVVNSPPPSPICSPSDVPGVVAWIDATTDTQAGTSNSLSPFEVSEPSGAVTAGPIAVQIDASTNQAYIAVDGVQCTLPDDKPLWGGSSVVAFDLATQTATVIWSPGLLPYLFEPGAIGVNASTGKIYAADDSGSIIVIDIATGSPIALTDPGTEPVAIAVNSATSKVYVANFQSGNITVVDGATNVLSTITDPKAVNPTGLAINQTTNTIYVTNSGSNNVTVIDGQTDSVVSTVPVGTFPIAVAVNPQTNFVYVANHGNSNANNPGSVSVIDGATNTTTTLTDPKAIGPISVAANSVTNKIYVANYGSNNVTVIDGAQ